MINFSQDHLILVTGASSGIGKATVFLLNELGAKVVAVARNEEKLNNLKKESKNPQNIFIEIKDLTENIEELDQWVKELSLKYGKFSGFVHSAGILNIVPIRIFDVEEAKKDFDLNYFSAIMITKTLSNKKYRTENLSVVFISSLAGIVGNVGCSTYAATKAALDIAVKSLVQEIGHNRIRINSICPGTIETDLSIKYNDNLKSDFFETVKKRTSFGEVGKPEHVADLAAFLISNRSYWITGQNIIIDGGEGLAGLRS